MGSDRFSSTATLRPRSRASHIRLVGGSDLTRPAKGRGVVHPIEVGTLVALPILATPGGAPFDLLEATYGRSVALLFVPADRTTTLGDTSGLARSLARSIEAAAGRLFVIASRADPLAEWHALLLDRDGGFAYSLGLADWDYGLGCADLKRPAGLVLDEVGQVIAADLDGSPDLGRLVDALPDDGKSIPVKGRTS